MGPQIVISPASPFTVDNIPFGVIKTAKDSTPCCASAIGDYAIDLSLYAQAGNLNAVKEGFDLTDIFSRVRFKALLAHLRGEFEFAERTRAGDLRAPSFKGLREDNEDAREVRRERPPDEKPDDRTGQ